MHKHLAQSQGGQAVSKEHLLNLLCRVYVQEISADEAFDELEDLINRIKRLEEALESIQEYWNRDNNERAMENACWHSINTASEALKAKEAK
jgi:hypothetical protein